MRGYTQLTQEQRYQIHALMKAGHYPTEITRIIDVHKSTISRESARNRGPRGYRPTQAHRFAMNRRQYKVRPRIGDKSWILVEMALREGWSPEQVSLWLRSNRGIRISHEWIYQYVSTINYLVVICTATFALNPGKWFRLLRLVFFSCDDLNYLRNYT